MIIDEEFIEETQPATHHSQASVIVPNLEMGENEPSESFPRAEKWNDDTDPVVQDIVATNISEDLDLEGETSSSCVPNSGKSFSQESSAAVIPSDEFDDLDFEEPKTGEGEPFDTGNKDLTTSTSTKKFFIWKWMGGEVLLHPAWKKFFPILITIAVMFIMNTCNSMRYIEKVKKIDSYEKKIENLNYMQLYMTKELTERSRQLDMEQRVQQRGLRLELSPTPPLLLYKDNSRKKDK